jgi:tetratricopeptide (TPR) repeat protein
VSDGDRTAMAYLLLARRARVEAARRRFARLGLRSAVDDETRMLLFAELYRSYFSKGDYGRAAEMADHMVETGVLVDAAHARAAAALQAQGDEDAAEKHLRSAARTAPGERRAYHTWVLGTFLHGQGRLKTALAAFDRAAKLDPAAPLYRASAVATRCAMGQMPDDVEWAIARLEASRSREGHGRLILGLLYRAAGDDDAARRHLGAFLRRCEADPDGRAVTLRREMEIARAALEGPMRPLARTERVARRVPRTLRRGAS